MRNFIAHSVLAIALTFGVTTVPVRAPIAHAADKAAAKAKKPDMRRVAEHLRDHVKYPATRQQILDACAQTDEFSAGEKAWAAAHLPEGNYASPDEVLKALGK
jgi:hypothetical protein